MFDKVQQLIGLVRPRAAEFTDARMDVLRRSDFKGKKQDSAHRESEGRKPYDSEQSTISVQSALLFLEGFLEAKLDAVFRPEKYEQGFSEDSLWLNKNSSNQNASLATRAYRHAAEIVEKIKNNGQTVDTGKSKEFRILYQLIKEMRELKDRGVDNVEIESGENFLEALQKSVAKLNLREKDFH